MRRVVGIVKPDTILAWQRRLEQRKWDYFPRTTPGPGRPRTPGEVEAGVCRLARENAWGYKRIHGELKKLGVKLSKSAISAVLHRNGLPPDPERGGLTWGEFLAREGDVLLCADLFTKEIWTSCGLQRACASARPAPSTVPPRPALEGEQQPAGKASSVSISWDGPSGTTAGRRGGRAPLTRSPLFHACVSGWGGRCGCRGGAGRLRVGGGCRRCRGRGRWRRPTSRGSAIHPPRA